MKKISCMLAVMMVCLFRGAIGRCQSMGTQGSFMMHNSEAAESNLNCRRMH